MNDIVLIIIITIIVILFYIILFQYNLWIKQVKKYSPAINEIMELNQKNLFYNDLKSEHRFEIECTSKQNLNRFDHSLHLFAIVEEQLAYFEDIIKKIEFNYINFLKYQQTYNQIASKTMHKNENKSNVPFILFKKIEQQLLQNLKIYPVYSTSIRIHATYTSPQGQNSYWISRTFNFEELKSTVNEVNEIIIKRQSTEYQRSLMTNSLRYDIMHRDNFTCKICGASNKDGVKLHVDHIVPVSKGGKTTSQNLRTLCDRCNLGKRDKIEQYTK